MSIDDRIEGAVDVLSEYVIDRELSPDQQIEYASYIRLLKMSAGLEKAKLTALVTEYPKALDAYDAMAVVNKKLTDYFKENSPQLFDVVEESIFNLPKERLMHPIDKGIQNTYANYCENVYKFVLIGAALGKLNLLSVQEIKNIVSAKVKEDIMGLKGRTDISKKLYNYVQKIDFSTPINECLNPDLLLELFAQKNEINIRKISMVAQKIEHTENAKEKITGTIVENKKKCRLALAKIAFFTLAHIAIIVAPIPYVIKFSEHAAALYPVLMVDDVKTKTDSGKNLKSKHFNAESIKPEIHKGEITEEFLNTTHRYVVKFFDTVDGMVRVQVYDYTYSDVSDETLRNTELDESNLIYDKVLSANELTESKNNGQSKVFGSYTGKAHIDISRVNYEMAEFYNPIVAMTYFTITYFGAELLVGGPILYALNKLYGKRMEELKNEYEETGELAKKSMAELEEIILELEKLKEQQSLKRAFKKVEKEPTVDSELRKYEAGRRHTS